MTDKMAIRTFPTAFKLKAIKRAEEAEGVLPVARKLGISRKLLHDWIKAWKAHGPEGLNRKPGPRRVGPLATNAVQQMASYSITSSARAGVLPDRMSTPRRPMPAFLLSGPGPHPTPT